MKYFIIRRIILALVPFIFFLLIGGCQQNKSQEAVNPQQLEKTLTDRRIILKIDDSVYRNSDFYEYIKNLIGEEVNSLPAVSLSRLFDNFIEEKLLLHAARDKKLSVTWPEKKEYLAKISNDLWAGQESKKVDKNLEERLLVEKYIYQLVKDIEVSPEEIKAYYDQHKREFLKPERVEVSQILLPTEDEAINVLEELKGASEEKFREVARRESTGVEASKGGKMGLFEMGELPFEMEKVIFSLDEREVSQVVESSYGYHIFRMDKKYDLELISLEEATPAIKIKLLDKKIKTFMGKHVQTLKENLQWSFSPQNLFFSYQKESQ